MLEVTPGKRPKTLDTASISAAAGPDEPAEPVDPGWPKSEEAASKLNIPEYMQKVIRFSR